MYQSIPQQPWHACLQISANDENDPEWEVIPGKTGWETIALKESLKELENLFR
jgi:hypothetical protein